MGLAQCAEYGELIPSALASAPRDRASVADVLRRVGLIERSRAEWRLTPAAKSVFENGTVHWPQLAERIVASAVFAQDAVHLLTLGEHPTEREARRVAPFITEVLSWSPEWLDGEALRVPTQLLESSLAEAAFEVAASRPEWVVKREEVGQRAEMYTLILARRQHGQHNVVHVAVEVGDYLGYDVEVRGADPLQVESKGSRGARAVFTMSSNQIEAARRYGSTYEIHFWGNIRLDRSPRSEFSELLEEKYPFVIADPAGLLDAGLLQRECESWHVEQVLDEVPR